MPGIRVGEILRFHKESLQSFFCTRDDCGVISEQQATEHGDHHN